MSTFTKQAIRAAFLQLLDQKPLDQITVRDIVETCGVSRNSFYYHFTDIPTMVTDLITQRADGIIAQYGSVDTLEECLTAAVDFARENKRAILHIYRSANHQAVEEHLMRICRHAVERYADTAIGDAGVTLPDREILIRFFQCELFGQMVAWLGEGMRYDIEAQFHRLCHVMRGMTETLIRRCLEDAHGQ